MALFLGIPTTAGIRGNRGWDGGCATVSKTRGSGSQRDHKTMGRKCFQSLEA